MAEEKGESLTRASSKDGVNPASAVFSLSTTSRTSRPHRVHRRFRSQADCSDVEEDDSDHPRRGEPVACRAEDIAEKLATKTRGGQTFPEYDSLHLYITENTTWRQLRREEIEKLVKVVRDPSEAIVLPSGGLLSRVPDNNVGYKILSLIVRSISIASSLCLLDNECINVNHCPQLISRERLAKLVKQAFVASRCPLTDITALMTHEGEAQDETEADAYVLDTTFDMIDYIAALLARLISQTASGSFWLNNTIAVLAARVAKMKYLLIDLCENALSAAQRGDDALQQLSKGGRPQPDIDEEEEECEEAMRILEADAKEGLASEEDAAITAHCLNHSQYRSGINTAFKHILSSLMTTGSAILPAGSFEICGVVYDIGFEGFKTSLFQDKDLQYSASSDRSVLNTSYAALRMLDQTMRCTAADMTPRPSNVSNQAESQTCVEWSFQELDSEDGMLEADYTGLRAEMTRVNLRHMEDVVAALVPISMTSPVMLADLTTFRTTMSLAGGMQEIVTPYRESHFGAYCRIFTKRFEVDVARRKITSLSKAFGKGQFSRCKLLPRGKRKSVERNCDVATGSVHQRGLLIRRELDNCCSGMENWIVDETSVTVSCKLYVATAMIMASILACGGVAIGFSVGERIPGVDPFNLAMYTWLVAAFILLIAKSVKVESWPWRDFLKWRVRCHSLSELASATGVSPQLVLAKLLHDDCGGSILRVRGPYNSAFRNRGDSGFAIDIPPEAETLTLSGLVLLKVVAPKGDTIICLDCRRGTYLTRVEHLGTTERSRLICDDMNRSTQDQTSRGRSLRMRLTRNSDFKWKRVQGLFSFQGRHVVFE